MNYQKACELLEIDCNNINDDIIKQQYRIFALKYHPDKNKSKNATEQFQNINDAYVFLLKNNKPHNTVFENTDINTSYTTILFSFLNKIIPSNENYILYTIIKRITTSCQEKSINLLESLDIEILTKIHEIILKHKDILHINHDFIKIIDNIIIQKRNNDEVIILNPSIDDILDNNLYKLTVNNFTYIITLWHHELIYDNNGNNIYIKCNPILPENITIDDSNDIHVNEDLNIKDIWNKETFKINIGKREYEFYTHKLSLLHSQVIIDIGTGISRINVKNIYDTSLIGNVYLHINLTLE